MLSGVAYAEDALKKVQDATEKDAADKAAANAVKDQINSLPSAEDVTTSDKEDIESARAAYEKLTDDQKAKIDESILQKLMDAEEALKKAEDAAADIAAFELYKTDQKSAAEALAQDSDSDECKQLITDAKGAIDAVTYDEQLPLEENKAAIEAIVTQLKAALEDQRSQDKPSGGCYVATCVYGSYDCPEVWTLRRFRDQKLAKTWYGRAFIKTYYTISPTIVKLVGDTDWFQSFWRGRLDKMVSNLQADGFASTPYQDRDW